MEVNEEKRAKFMENAGKRVNKVMHDIQILEPMARSSVYDFTKEDVEEMFTAMQDALELSSVEILHIMIWCVMNLPRESHRLNLQQESRFYSE